MVIILRFVNCWGILTECFFHIKSVSNTTSTNLKKWDIRYSYSTRVSGGKKWEGKRMMVLVICVAFAMDFRYYFLEIVHMHIMLTALPIDYSWHWFLQLEMLMLFDNSFFTWTIISILPLLLQNHVTKL